MPGSPEYLGSYSVADKYWTGKPGFVGPNEKIGTFTLSENIGTHPACSFGGNPLPPIDVYAYTTSTPGKYTIKLPPMFGGVPLGDIAIPQQEGETDLMLNIEKVPLPPPFNDLYNVISCFNVATFETVSGFFVNPSEPTKYYWSAKILATQPGSTWQPDSDSLKPRDGYYRYVEIVDSDPDTDITFFTYKDKNSERRDCEDGNVWINYDTIVTHGTSVDEDGVVKAEFGWDVNKLPWQNVNNLEDETNWGDQEVHWFTDQGSEAIVLKEGLHRVSGRAQDIFGNQENEGINDVNNVPDDDSCNVCVDLQKPNQVKNLHHSDEDRCGMNDMSYDNDGDLYFSWDETIDNGPDCSGIKEYNAYLRDASDDSLLYTHHPTETHTTFSGPKIVNGGTYYAVVRAVDKAGNVGLPVQSENVLVDKDKPIITIIPDEADAEPNWYKDNFDVEIDFEDELSGLCECGYEIYDNDDFVRGDDFDCFCNADWSETITITVGKEADEADCTTIGKNTCRLDVYVEDKAGNTNEESEYFSIDYEPPTTEKTVGEPKYGKNDYYVTSESVYNLTCNDQGGDGIGCDKTYYRYYAQGSSPESFTEYTEPFNIQGDDGVYTVEFYSKDKLGNTEDVTSQEHYLDNTNPEAEKTEDPLIEQLNEFDLSGPINYNVAEEEGVFIWKEGNEWKVRWTDDWSDQTWSHVVVKVILGSPLTNVEKYSFDNDCEGTHPDCLFWSQESQIITADTWVDNGEDGINFTQEDDNALVAFEIYYNDKLAKSKVFIGSPRVNPSTDPFIINLNRWVSGDTEFTLTASDDGSGIKDKYYRIDEGSWTTYSTPFGISSEDDGIHEIEYYAEDNLGQTNKIQKQLVILDKKGPAFTILNGFEEGMDISCQQSIVINMTDEGVGVKGARVEWYKGEELIDSQEMTYDEGTDAWHATFDKLWKWEEGSYSVKVIAYDKLDNENSKTYNVNLPAGVICASVQSPCVIEDPSIGGTCKAKMYVGIRGGNGIMMDMEDLFG
ncbi:MAG: hypothetical protein DRN49_02865, partial [Thaumarchaeota archaeon]